MNLRIGPLSGRLLAGFVLASLFVLFASSASMADIVHLKDGRTVEGKIVEETSTFVRIETRFGGVRRIEQDRIVRIERKKTAREEYEGRLRRTNSKDAESLYSLGVWCKENGLVVESLEAHRKVLKLDRNHAGSRKALGYVYRDGKWIRGTEAETKPEPEADRGPGKAPTPGRLLEVGFLEDAGFVRHKGEWVTLKEKKDLDKGLLPYGGRFFPPSDIERMKEGFVKVGKDWVDVADADRRHDTWDTAWEITTTHFKIKSDWPRQEIDRLGEQLEKNFREYARVIGGPPKERLRLYAFQKHTDYLEFLDANKMSKFRRSDAFFDARTGLVVGWSGKNYNLVRRIIGGVCSWQYFKYSYDSAMPGWLAEGISIYFRRFGFDADGNYVRAKPDLKRLEDILEGHDTQNLIPLNDLIRLEMFTAIDKGMTKFFSAQSWALVTYFLETAGEEHQRKFLDFMDELRKTFFVMGNAEFISAGMMENIFNPEGLKEVEKGYVEAARRLAESEGLLE